jgi:hypothetical protein
MDCCDGSVAENFTPFLLMPSYLVPGEAESKTPEPEEGNQQIFFVVPQCGGIRYSMSGNRWR